jgi:hypothetical protein
MKTRPVLIAILLLSLLGSYNRAVAQGTAFTYQGELSDSGGPLNGFYDLTFTLFDALTAGNQVPSGGPNPNLKSNVQVNGGLFTVTLDFGSSAFTGGARWLEITVHPHAGGATTTLSPRQQLTPTPYAIFAENVANAGISAAQLNTPGSPSSGQVLSYNGTSLFWAPPASGGFALPYNSGAVSSPSSLFTLNNTGAGPAAAFLGNVGIGTTTPGGTLSLFNSSSDLILKLEDRRADGSFSRFHSKESFYDYGGEATYVGLEHNYGEGPAPRALVFGTSADGNPPTEKMRLTRNGALGIGTTSPGGLLSLFTVTSDLLLKFEDRRADGSFSRFHSKESFYDYGGEAAYVGLEHNYGEGPAPRALVFGTSADGNPPTEKMRLTRNGNVGIGTTAPSKKLELHGAGDVELGLQSDDSGGRLWTVQSSNGGVSGYFQIIDRTAGLSRLQIGTDGTVSVGVLQINGADVAEPFELSAKDIPKGSLVIIDEENPGKVKLSDHAYDNRVAGILSGANGVNSGILLKQQGFNDGGQNVALSGRVYALADASFGTIKPGDLLTTSDTPGHCMKVTDHAKAQGAIIGKAMSALKEGKGMVLVLVSLQ